MDLRAIKEAGFVSRIVHIVILAAIVAPGIVFRSRALVAALTAVWFVLFAVVYLLVRPHPTVRNHTSHHSR